MAIAHAPRLEVVLSPEGKTGPEGAEIGESALFNPYLIMHNPDGSATNLQLDSGPFNYEEGLNFIVAVCTHNRRKVRAAWSHEGSRSISGV
jgi:hypothetical protein